MNKSIIMRILAILLVCISVIIGLSGLLIPISQIASYMDVRYYLLAQSQNVSVDTKAINNLILMKRVNKEGGLIGDVLINDIISYVNIKTNNSGDTKTN